jgi:signal transduction histidine kinase/ligand-binding sensor domain-containing protein
MPFRPARLIYVMLALVMLPALSGRALPGAAWSSRSWQTDEGLPDNSVTGVAQSADGYLWVATYGGLMRFNGAKFSAIPLPTVYKKSVRTMLLDRQGRLWLGTDQGSVVCLASNSARVFGIADGMPAELIAAMAEDGEGAVWVIYSSIHSSMLCRIKDGHVTRFAAAEGLPDGINAWVTTDVRGEVWFSKGGQVGVVRDGRLLSKITFPETSIQICQAASGGLWICAGARVMKYAEGREPEAVARLPDNAEPQGLYEDHAGALWIGTMANGLFRLKDGALEGVPTSQQSVGCVSEDREGNIWAGTRGGGLNLIRPSAVELVDRDAGLPFEAVASICEDTAGVVWAAGQSGTLTKFQNGKWQVVGAAAGWTGEAATCVAADRKGGIWIGSRNHSLFYFHDGDWSHWLPQDGLHTGAVHVIFVTKNDDVWVVTGTPSRLQQLRGGHVAVMFDLPGQNRVIRAMAEGADGTLWVGTLEGQVLRVDGAALVPEAAAKDTGGAPIRALETTADGSLWIGYAGSGLGRLKGGKFSLLTTANGLMDDFASQLLADGPGNLWIVGNRGLFQVQSNELAAVAEGRAERVRSLVFGRNEGLPSFQPNTASSPNVCQAHDGRLWFALRSGLLTVQPQNIHPNPVPPPVIVERVRVDDQTAALYDAGSPAQTEEVKGLPDLRRTNTLLRIPPGNRKVEFEFAALSFASPENVQFRYRLDNYDEKWTEADSVDRSVKYPPLPAGRYCFRVLACNNAGVWNETGAALNLEVWPFFWQTWWFRGLALFTFTAGVVAIVRYVSFRRLRERMKQLEQVAALEKERTRIARDMHDEVGAKLTRLSLLSEMAGSHSAMPSSLSGDVKEISDTARETIRSFEEIVWAVNPRNDTLADLVHYLCRYAEDYFEGSPVQCAFDLPPEIPAIALPTEFRHQVFLAAKEALNNVLKHSKAGRVRVQLAVGAEDFKISVEDDGCGFDTASPPARAGGGNGLENMRERLRSLGGRFECESKPGGGTRIRFNVPRTRGVGG